MKMKIVASEPLKKLTLEADDEGILFNESAGFGMGETYHHAFREIDADPNNELIVAELDGEVVGTLQLTYIPSISFQGGKRCTVESVRVDEKFRGKGIGREMMRWAIERAKAKGCISMQLTTNNDRTDAHRFYESLGFSKSHVGMKLKL